MHLVWTLLISAREPSRQSRDWKSFSKGFLQSEVLGEVSFLEGGSSGRSFPRSLPRSFPRSFRPCFAGTFRAKNTSAKTSALNSHGPAQQNWRNFREKLHDEVLQGDPRQEKLPEGLLGSWGGGGFGRKFPEGGLDFLEVALVWRFPYEILPKQTSQKLVCLGTPQVLLRSPFP